MAAVDQLSAIVGVKPACQALTVPRASWYRRRNRRLFPRPAAVLRCSPRALTEAEQQAVLSSLYADRFQDSSPAQVYAALLDEGQFHCSIRTMYRLLEARGGSGERRAQLTHPPYQKPELLATQATSCGVGISPNCAVQQNGPAITYTSIWMFSAVSLWAG
jgi:putative transposase